MMNDFSALVKSTRSTRRFSPGSSIDRKFLENLVDIARFSPSAVNAQPIRYMLFSEKDELADIFPRLKWAGLLKDKFRPQTESERPEGYIVMLADASSVPERYLFDAGLAAQTILLAARSAGISGCICGAFDKEKFRTDYSVSDAFVPLMIIALGKGAETFALEDSESTAYYRDENDVHHVPKLPLSKIILR